MTDTTIVLPPQARTVDTDNAGRVSQLGVPLRQRPTAIPDFPGDGDGPEVVLDIGTPDGNVEVGDDGSIKFPQRGPLVKGTGTQDQGPNDFGENLAEWLDEGTLSQIASEVIDGTEADIMSRSGWIDQYNKGIELLGTKIEDIPQSNSNRRNISRSNHPLMIEAIIKYWAMANGEMLPASGPVKVPTIGTSTDEENERAKSFEDDFNYIMTDVIKEYYPDTSSMLIHQGFCGIGYKKVYQDPLKRRPTSQSILAPNLIVSEEATDLDTALRVTHEIEMIRSQVRRMQIAGQYRNIQLGQPGPRSGIGGSPERAIRRSEGLNAITMRPQDQPFIIWETDTDLDIDHYRIDARYEMDSPEGMPLPYKITVDHESRQVLGLWRNWRQADPLYHKKNMYVKFGLVPGLGYHNWGFLQLLGNQTRALRGIWRLLIDAGMFSNFPGGIKAKGIRSSTNEIAPGPGEWVEVDVPPGMKLSDALFPMPYKDISGALVQLSEIIKNDAMRLGGTVQLETGEGRTNVPVGTVLSMVEQQVQVMAAVQRQNHRAQRDELHLLRELFAEDPASLTKLARLRTRTDGNMPRQWQVAEEFMDLDLSPASDPNVPSQVHRVMMANVLVMLAQQAGPGIMDIQEVLRTALLAIGAQPDRYVIRPEQQAGAMPPPAPDPKVVAETIKQQTAQQKQIAEGQQEAAKIQMQREQLAAHAAEAAAGNQTALKIAETKATTDLQKPFHEAAAAPPPPPGGIGTPTPH